MDQGQVFVLSGPPGAGKSTVGARVRQAFPDLAYSVSFTTRAPRPGESEGVDYHFVSREDFLGRLARGEMVEHVEVFGNLYGTSRQAISETVRGGQDLFLDTEVNGGAALKQAFPQGVFIFLVPPSPRELERRLRGRGTESAENIQERLARVAYELAAARDYTHLVVNDDLEQAVSDIGAIIRTDRLRCARRFEELRRLWGV
ncbi:MAG: guanylate kinase [Pseudomonadota bacterium]